MPNLRLLSVDELREAIESDGWASIHDGRPSVNPPAQCFQTDYEPCGIVGADMTEIVLTQVLPERVRSGFLQIVGTSVPTSREQYSIIQYILALCGHGHVNPRDFRFEFRNDYEGLVSVMSWCIACGWEFDFVATGLRYGVRTESDERIALCWADGVPTRATVPDLLRNLDFHFSRAWFTRG